MRKMSATNRENDFPEDYVLVSSTDVKGRITFVNEVFCEVAGFDESDLIGAPHNLIRHPDVPPAVFADMWQNLKAGRSWMGIVKNRCHNGDHYWVSAHVSPLFDNGKIIGYESVRRKATPAEKVHAQALYDRINSGKSAIPRTTQLHSLVLQQIWLNWLLYLALGGAGIYLTQSIWSTVAVVTMVLGIYLTHTQRNSLVATLNALPVEAHNPIGQYLYCKTIGPHAAIRFAQIHKEAAANTFRYRLAASSHKLESRALQAKDNVTVNLENFNQQRDTFRSVVSASAQLQASVQQISTSISITAQDAESVEQQTKASQTLAESTGLTMRKVYEEVNAAKMVVDVLAKQSDEITQLVDSISGIAEQTNLLALNAAIESARAGEAGRGFAVVADEVRALAIRTQDATQKINETTESLKQNTSSVLAAIEQGAQVADEGVQKVTKVAENMAAIEAAIRHVAELTSQINQATTEQAKVANDLNEQMQLVDELSLASIERAEHIVTSIAHIEEEAYEQGNLAERMKA
ncbi:methyl-accepting chemotaxis protein [Maribrevibacterium harenarium]|uniref:Methyl-accepting chemotaxis protein n=1 Tax=Maribrevibacterium harenarium TaxID=2589817 RepID=A0A501X2H3_9GAMM|nr:PAS domain-containing methyl-accepting chemotaxis protein [Maribrevibacterium harenarium]TPE54679.1 methyl-accepting chemotaxis protein [Maribrevibacterium harenarium]